jgi:hypothetical protein
MALAGQPPEVTHELPIGRQRRRHYLYLRVCDGCGDRRVGRSVRYGVCRCGARNRYLVLRTPAGAGGLALLRAMPLSEVRRRCIMPGPA